MTITHRLPLDGGHVMHVEEHGNPAGLPVVVLHGGPGSGSSPLLRRDFDPAHYRIVCPDQRGSGLSTPAGSIKHNTLADLLADLRLLRAHLHIDRWLVVGGSWGATLALMHALDAPEAVAGLLLRNVFLARESDIHALFAGALRHDGPARRVLWDEAERRQCPVTVPIAEVFARGTWARQCELTRNWFAWEQRLASGAAAPLLDEAMLPRLVTRYRVQSHYLRHGCWLDAPTLLQRCAAAKPAVPTLIVHGTNDALCPPEGAQALAQVLGAPLQWAQGAGHDPTHPAIAAAMQQALRDYAATQAFGISAAAP